MPASSTFVHSPYFRLLLVILLSVMAGVLSYQAPVNDAVAIGWPGDQLVLDSSAGLGQDAVERGDLYADALTPDSPTGRSRWTRQHAHITLPNIGSGSDLEATLLVQGWPEDVVASSSPGTRQPSVTLYADGQKMGTFVPTRYWERYTFAIPSSASNGAHLQLDTVTSATFTDTSRGSDPRPKGIRLAQVAVHSTLDSTAWREATTLGEQAQVLVSQVLPPVWEAIALQTLVILLLFLLLSKLLPSSGLTFVLTVLATGASSAGLALARIWMGVVLQVGVWLLIVALVLAWYPAFLKLLRALLWRYTQGNTLNYGLVVAALVWLGYTLGVVSTQVVAYVSGSQAVRDMFPDSLLIGGLATTVLALVLVMGRDGLPQVAAGAVKRLEHSHAGLILLLLVGGTWLGYEAWVISGLPYVGHADYADNAVVARNLVAGRGWVVDYVTQFYTLYEGVTRPQETWPLLQPVWIAPFLALFGNEAWAAKVPNLLFNTVLFMLVFAAGSHLWNRRVGMTAAILTLVNHLFFTLTIYTTSDLAFVVFAFAAIYALYRAAETARSEPFALSHGHEGKTYAVEYHGQAAFAGSGSMDIQPLHMARMTSGQTGAGEESAGQVQQAVVIPALAQPATAVRGVLVDRAVLAWLIGAGVLTGLMMLQKPGSALIAVGMGLWLLWQQWERGETTAMAKQERLSPVGAFWRVVLRRSSYAAVWTLPALLLLMPYMLRNIALFDAPVYSTEKYDAWVLGYRGDSEEAWNDIYRVYIPELGGQGVPDRSWILRWGFDHTLQKLQNQVRAVREYLMPVWSNLPERIAGTDGHLGFLSTNERKNIFSPLGAWLSWIGVIGAVWYRRRLLTLLTMAFVPYTLFLVTYWHANEERYFLALIPWLALLSAWIIWAGYDRLAAVDDRRWSPAGLLLVVFAIVTIIRPSWPVIAYKVQDEPDKWAPDVRAYEWLRENTPADAVVMTRNPWQLNWHAQRAAVMIPNTSDYDILLFLAQHYDVDYIVFDSIQRVKSDAAQLLAPLINPEHDRVGTTIYLRTEGVDGGEGAGVAGGAEETERYGFQLVYVSPTPDNRVLIYRMPPLPE